MDIVIGENSTYFILSDFKVYPRVFLRKTIINMQFFFKLRSYHDKKNKQKKQKVQP